MLLPVLLVTVLVVLGRVRVLNQWVDVNVLLLVTVVVVTVDDWVVVVEIVEVKEAVEVLVSSKVEVKVELEKPEVE